MTISIETTVDKNIHQVFKGFNQSLFLKLSPPFPPVRLQRFDGCIKGDQVHLQLNFILFKQDWTALIIDSWANSNEYGFVDVGIALPFFISKWQHTHLITTSTSGGCTITDLIEFKSPFGWLIYPLLYIQFLYRKPIYKRIFSNK